MSYAGFWIRVGAYIIDAIILGVVSYALYSVLGINTDFGAAGTSFNSTGSGAQNAVSLIVGLAYFGGLESSAWQGTVGKKALGLIVVDTEGNRITLPRALGRYLAKILSALILLIGFIMVAFTDKKQGLHDLICSTLVVKGQPGEHSAKGVFD